MLPCSGACSPDDSVIVAVDARNEALHDRCTLLIEEVKNYLDKENFRWVIKFIFVTVQVLAF